MSCGDQCKGNLLVSLLLSTQCSSSHSGRQEAAGAVALLPTKHQLSQPRQENHVRQGIEQR